MAKKKIAKTPRSEAAEPSFEDSLAELEQIVVDLEGGDLGLDESLQKYELGVARLKRCQQQLRAAEQRIEVLSGIDADGNPVCRPLDEADSPSTSRAAKRSAAPTDTGVDDSARLF